MGINRSCLMLNYKIFYYFYKIFHKIFTKSIINFSPKYKNIKCTNKIMLIKGAQK